MKTIHTKDPAVGSAYDALPPVEEGERRLRVVRISPKGTKSYVISVDEAHQHLLDLGDFK